MNWVERCILWKLGDGFLPADIAQLDYGVHSNFRLVFLISPLFPQRFESTLIGIATLKLVLLYLHYFDIVGCGNCDFCVEIANWDFRLHFVNWGFLVVEF